LTGSLGDLHSLGDFDVLFLVSSFEVLTGYTLTGSLTLDLG